MFQSLVNTIKKELSAVRTDSSHVLIQMEETEQVQDSHEATIKEL